MGCGTKVTGRFHSYWEREEIADTLEREGEYKLARSVKRGDCLDSRELRDAERALERQGKQKNFDYREESCHCEPEEEY